MHRDASIPLPSHACEFPDAQLIEVSTVRQMLFQKHFSTKGGAMNQSYLASCTRSLKFPYIMRMFLCLIAVAISDRASLLAESGSPLRTGLWVTQRVPENTGEMTEFESMVRTNPHLSGVCLHIGWKELERESGHLDFSAIDKTVAVLRRIGRKYELGIKPGADTPPFIYEEGGQSFATHVTNPHRPNFGEAVVIPVPWDPIYQSHFSHVIQQLGERYAADPLCVSVVLTCANYMGAEMHLPKRPEDRAKWNAMGDCEAKLLEVYMKYTDEWAKAFPKQAISLHLSQVLDLPSRFFERIIDYGLSKYAERFTIQNCQLRGRKEDTGLQSYDLVQKYRDRAHHGFQSVAGFSHSGERMGSIQMAVLNLVHANGEYWELWHGDGVSAETSARIAKAWEKARRLGYDAYKDNLISEGSYRQGPDGYRATDRRGRRNAGLSITDGLAANSYYSRLAD
jgi:Beta-galactosidase